MKPLTMVFRLEADDPFQAKLEDALKSLRYGLRSRFFVNVCRSLMAQMDKEEMVAKMTQLSHSLLPPKLEEPSRRTEQQVSSEEEPEVLQPIIDYGDSDPDFKLLSV